VTREVERPVHISDVIDVVLACLASWNDRLLYLEEFDLCGKVQVLYMCSFIANHGCAALAIE